MRRGRCRPRAGPRRIRRRLGLQSHTFEYQEGPLELGIEQRPDSRTRQPYAHGGQHLTEHRRAAFHVTAAQPRFSGSSSQVGHGGMVWRRRRQLLRAHCQTIARLGAPSEVRQRLAETGVEAPDSHPLGPQGQRVAIEAGGAIECQRLGRTFRRLDDVSACQGHLTPEAEVMVQNLGICLALVLHRVGDPAVQRLRRFGIDVLEHCGSHAVVVQLDGVPASHGRRAKEGCLLEREEEWTAGVLQTGRLEGDRPFEGAGGDGHHPQDVP